MRCERCENTGTKHKVYRNDINNSYTNSEEIDSSTFWDEDDKYHNHNPGSYTAGYTCSNGHKFLEAKYGHCWCGWSGGKDSISHDWFDRGRGNER